MVHNIFQKTRILIFFNKKRFFSCAANGLNLIVQLKKISLYSKVWSPGSIHGTVLNQEIVPLSFYCGTVDTSWRLDLNVETDFFLLNS